MKRLSRRLAVSLFAIGILFGVWLSRVFNEPAQAQEGDIYSKLDIFAKVLHYVETNYVEEVNQQELIYGALKGMLDTLDPHTVFMPPDVYRELKMDTSGEFQGIGLMIEKRGADLLVVKTVPGSPAERSGLNPGDKILLIDGQDTQKMSIHQAVTQLRGAAGTPVRLRVQAVHAKAPTDLTLVRERIRTLTLDYRLIDATTGYIRIKLFQAGTASQLARAVQRMEQETKAPLQSLILDLRENPGGLLEEAVKVVDEFVEEGTVVSVEGRNRARVEIQSAHAGGCFTRGKLVILIDSVSASASEIVAGAIKDLGRGTLIGARSFGKGSVQQVIDLEDGSALKITVARYYTPKRTLIDKHGIDPDIRVVSPTDSRILGTLSDDRSVFTSDSKGEELVKKAPAAAGIDDQDYPLRAAYGFVQP